jgi:multidrug resistance efflux pump
VDKGFAGDVVGQQVDVRFAFSGAIQQVNKRQGDQVKKGEVLAILDKKLLQNELDKQLADYEKSRADFEIFNQKNPNPADEITKYLKVTQQAQLNGAVKDVELAKLRLDQCELKSPIDGVIMDDGGCVPGIYVTPSAGAYKIVSLEKLRLMVELDQNELSYFRSKLEVKVAFEGIGEFQAVTELPIPGMVSGKDTPKFAVFVDLPQNEMFLPGMMAEVRI